MTYKIESIFQPKDSARLVAFGDAGKVLIAQRSLSNSRHNAGKWQFPGGKIDAGETAAEATLREAGEELGLTADILVANFFTHSRFYREKGDKLIRHRTAYAVGRVSCTEFTCGSEVERAEWVDITALQGFDFTSPCQAMANHLASTVLAMPATNQLASIFNRAA